MTAGLAVITNVWWAVTARLLTGALNSNFALSRAQIADLVPNGQRAMPYAYLGASFALARTFSSGVAGLSVGSLERVPAVTNNTPNEPAVTKNTPIVPAMTNTRSVPAVTRWAGSRARASAPTWPRACCSACRPL